VDVLVPNAHEAALLTGADTSSPQGCLDAGRVLQERGCHSVVITRGDQGCVVVDRDAVHLPACAVNAVDTVGAGDAFCGVLAVALAERTPLPEAAELAMRAGAISATRRGAQPSMPTRAQVERFPSC